MYTLETKHGRNSNTLSIRKEAFFEKKVEDSVNQKILFNFCTNRNEEPQIVQLFKITQEDLISEDGTKLAAFVDADDHYELFFESIPSKDFTTIENIEPVSRSWPPPLKNESEQSHELLSSFELV